MNPLDALIDRLFAYKIEPHRVTPAKYGIPFEEVRIPASDGGALYGWWISSTPAAPTLILLHGWGRNLSRTLPYIEALHPLGYNLLAFDARNHGSSTPVPRPTVGVFAQDVLSAIEYLRQRGVTSIGLLGLSVGGGAVINAAGWDKTVQAVVTIGAISHPIALMKYEFSKRHIPAFAGNFLLNLMRRRYKIDFDAIAPLHNLPQAQADVLVIHGENDLTVPLAHGQALAAAGKPGKTRLWIVPAKGHSDCHTHPQFWDTVCAFLQETLPVSQ